MKGIIIFIFSVCQLLSCTAQTQRFDMTSFAIPKGWQKTSKGDTYTISKEDQQKGIYCMITLYKGLTAGTDAKENFDHSWEVLAKGNFGAEAIPAMQPEAADEGWRSVSGSSGFEASGLKGIALLVSTTGYGKLVNILILTNTGEYEKEITAFLESVNFNKPAGQQTNTIQTAQLQPTAAVKGKFKFTTTNFDDGWTATEQPDWVEVIKGNVKILLHYPSDIKPSNDMKATCQFVWNSLVAPRYKNIRNYRIGPDIMDFEQAYFSCATLTDATGKDVFVALFSKAESGWIEIICPDENTFIQTFGIDISKLSYNSSTLIYNPLKNLAKYNKFAVAASDLGGKWTNSFAGNTYYTNINTGLSAGMSTYSSGQEYNFLPGQKYNWSITVANSYGGQTNFGTGKGEGTWKMDGNWKIYFSNMEGKPKTSDVQFTCVKGGRILWINGTQLVLVK